MVDNILTFQSGVDMEQIPIFLAPFRLEQAQVAHKQITQDFQHLIRERLLSRRKNNAV